MDNFNLKKFLVENKLTTNSKLLKENNEYKETVVYEDDENRIKLVYEPAGGSSYDADMGMEGDEMPYYLVNDFHGEDWDVINSYFENPSDREIAQDIQDHLGEVDSKGFFLKDFGYVEKAANIKPDTAMFSSNE
jgi:hypothetical protein